MRDLILKMSMSIDGFVSDLDGTIKWMFGSDELPGAADSTVLTALDSKGHRRRSTPVTGSPSHMGTSQLLVECFELRFDVPKRPEGLIGSEINKPKGKGTTDHIAKGRNPYSHWLVLRTGKWTWTPTPYGAHAVRSCAVDVDTHKSRKPKS